MSDALQDFNQTVIERSHQLPVLADFWAPWCGPCRVLGPVLDKLAASAGGRWELVKVNIDEHPEIAQRFNIASIPSVKMFHRGEVVDEFLGVLPEPQIVRWIQAVLPSPHADQIVEAKKLMESGDDDGARSRLREILHAEPENNAAKLLLVETLLSTNVPEAMDLAGTIPGSAPEFERANILRELAGLIQRSVSAASLDGDPVQQNFAKGLVAARGRHWESALEHLLSVVEARKNHADGAALAGIRLIFQLLGPRHPAVSANHRRFSSVVNS